MQQYIEVTGKNEDEALSKALSQLGLDRDQVSVEILERAKSGFLGIGSVPAKIRVTYEIHEAYIPASAHDSAPTAHFSDTPPTSSSSVPTSSDVEESNPISANIHNFLVGLLAHMAIDATPVVTCDGDTYLVEFTGSNLGSLIGHHGETLDTIQQLTRYAVNRNHNQSIRLHMDAENYRARRAQSLEHLAHKVAAKVIKYRRNVTLEPMNAYERHIIHTALQDYPGIRTYSTGTEPHRCTVVALDRSSQA